jgi:hypothetical protein
MMPMVMVFLPVPEHLLMTLIKKCWYVCFFTFIVKRLNILTIENCWWFPTLKFYICYIEDVNQTILFQSPLMRLCCVIG